MLLCDKFQNNLQDTKVGVFGMCYSNKQFFYVYYYGYIFYSRVFLMIVFQENVFDYQVVQELKME